MPIDLKNMRISDAAPKGHRKHGVYAEVLANAGHCISQCGFEAGDRIGGSVLKRTKGAFDLGLGFAHDGRVLDEVPEEECECSCCGVGARNAVGMLAALSTHTYELDEALEVAMYGTNGIVEQGLGQAAQGFVQDSKSLRIDLFFRQPLPTFRISRLDQTPQ